MIRKIILFLFFINLLYILIYFFFLNMKIKYYHFNLNTVRYKDKMCIFEI